MGRAATRILRAIGALAVLGAGLGGASPAQADDFTVGGAFDDLNNVVLIEFSHPGGAFLAFTSQWNNRPGLATPAADPALDGFDALLQLFIGTGPTATFDQADDDGCADTPIVAECIQTIGGTTFTGGILDSLLDLGSLAAGDYTLGLTVFSNLPNGPTLGDGYNDAGSLGSFIGPNFRVHLLGIGEILNVQSPNPVSISGPFTAPDA